MVVFYHLVLGLYYIKVQLWLTIQFLFTFYWSIVALQRYVSFCCTAKLVIHIPLLFSFSSHLGHRQWHPTPVLLPGKSHGWRSLVGCSPWGRWGSDTTERLHVHFSLTCIGEGNGNPLQCSCLESLRDRGAWWAAVYGIAPSRHDWSDLAAAAACCFP